MDVNYHTLADFRTEHHWWLKQQVALHIASMRAEGLTSLDVIGQDGMRVRACAGNDSFKREPTLEQLLEEAEQRWNRLQQEFEQETKLSARQRAAQERALREKIERPDLNSLVIVGVDVVNVGSDAGQMEPMVQQIEAEQPPCRSMRSTLWTVASPARKI